jgi:hypothetical protein
VLLEQEAETMDRRVRTVRRDREGNIVALCNAGASWSPRRKSDVIADILENKRSYYVQEQQRRSYVRVVDGTGLRTTRNVADVNSLDKLADA